MQLLSDIQCLQQTGVPSDSKPVSIVSHASLKTDEGTLILNTRVFNWMESW